MKSDIHSIVNLLLNSISEHRDSATLAYAKILSNYTDNNEVLGILIKSLIKSGHLNLAENHFKKNQINVTDNIHIAEAYFDYLCLSLNFEEAFFHVWSCLNASHINGDLVYIENALNRLDTGEIKQGRTKEFIKAKAALLCQLEIPLKDKIILSFSETNYKTNQCELMPAGEDARIFFDISLLLRLIASKYNPTSIQRFICEIINAIYELHPNCYTFFVVPHYCAALTMHCSEFLDIINSKSGHLELEKIIAGDVLTFDKRKIGEFNAREDDCLILADAFWQIDILPHIISQIDSVKCKKLLLVHDLIPIILDFEPLERDVFESCLLAMLECVDGVITNSYFTNLQVKKFIDYKSVRLECKAIPFAAQRLTLFPVFFKPEISFSNFLQAQGLSEGNFILTVSSVSKRKRILELANSFLQLIETHDTDIKLVIVGQDVTGSSDIGDLLEKTCTQSNGQIIWLKDVGDDTLDVLYKSCLFFAYPSLYEGWGLPVGEALSYGKVPIVHAVTSLPEVAGDYGIYCGISQQDLLATLKKFIVNRKFLNEAENKLKQGKLRSWASVAKDIIEAAS